MKKSKFRLSPSGKLAASLAIIITSLTATQAADIIGAGDAGHNPGISQAANGAAVVNIVTPNASGLSHNQYQDFNVNKPGAVLNNALNDGQSQLAGQLNANPNLNGQAANVILNEVISRNPSLLLGKQEIFGMAADYVLANPNGIACDGCGFINTNRSALVVGNPLLEKGALTGFNTFGNDNTLSIRSGGLQANSVLDLIAPKIDSRGKVIATQQINALSGHNQTAADGSLVRAEDVPNSSLDSYYLGSMQAGRIRLVNTTVGSGVNLAGEFTGLEGIDVSSQGNLGLQAANLRGGDIGLQGKNIDAQGVVKNSSTNRDGSENYNSTWSGQYVNDRSTTQRLQRTVLTGKNITLNASDRNRLTATDIQGDNVTLQGGELTLDGQMLTQTQGHTHNQDKLTWRHNVTTESEQRQQIGTSVKARENATLKATAGDIQLKGSSVEAGNNLALNATGDIQLTGLVEQKKSTETGYRKNHTASLLTGNWQESSESESLKKSQLRAGDNLGLTAGNAVVSRAGNVQAGKDLLVTAEKVRIDVQKTANRKTQKDNKTAWGGIGGGDNKDNANLQEISQASELTAGGKLLVSGNQGVTITGSKVKGTQGGFVQTQHGDLVIDNAVSTTTDKVNSRTGTVFNITKGSQKTNNSMQQTVGSELKSDADLKLFSQQDITVVGSLVKSAGELGIDALGDVNVKAAELQHKIDEEKTALSLKGHAEKTGDKQYRAGVNLDHTRDTENTERSENKSSTLSGESVTLASGKDVTFTGSQLVAHHGDAKVSGNNVTFTAAEDQTTSESSHAKTGGGFYYVGGMDKAGSGIQVGHESSKTHSDGSKALVSGTQVSGDLVIAAKGDLTHQGTQQQIGGKYQVDADNVHNLAAKNSDNSTTTTLKVGVDIGVNADYSAITRPLERAGGKVASLDAGGTLNDIGGIGAPNVGIDVNASGSSSDVRKNSEQAVVNTVNAGDISINAGGAIRDQGTQYKANQGGVTLDAESHSHEAAVNRDQTVSRETNGSAGVRVYTTTGSDVVVDAKGQGGTTRSDKTNEQAVAGGISAVDGITIRVKDDARYTGTALDAGKGKVNVTAGGDIAFEQATDRETENHSGFNVKTSGKGGFTADSKSFGGGLGGDYDKGESKTSHANVSQLQGLQGVELNAGQDLTLQGSEIGSKDRPVGDVTLNGNKVDLQAAQSSHWEKSTKFSGNLDAGGSKGETDKKTSAGGNFGFAADYAKVDQSTNDAQGGGITSSGNLNIQANGDNEQAIHLEGTQVSSKNTVLNADNGGIVLESAKSGEHKDNWNLGGKANGKLGQSFGKDEQGAVDSASGKKTHTAGVGATFGLDRKQAGTQKNTQIATGDLSFSSDADTVLAGAKVKADKVDGSVGGDLRIESRRDTEQSLKVGVDVGLSHTNDPNSSVVSKVSKVGTPRYADKVKETLEGGANKVFDKAEEKYNQTARGLDSKQDTTNGVSFSKAEDKVTLPETLANEKEGSALWDKGARKAGNVAKESLLGPAGRDGHFKVTADVVKNDAVGEQTALSGKQGVNLTVQGKTQLIGGQIGSQKGQVDLNSGGLEQSDMNGKRYHGGGSADVAATLGSLLSGSTKDILSGDSPFIKVDKGTTEVSDARGAIISHKTVK